MFNLKKFLTFIVAIFFCNGANSLPLEKKMSNAEERFSHLSTHFFQSLGYPDTFKLIDGAKSDPNYQNDPIGPVAQGNDDSGGPVVCIQDGKIVASSADPTLVGKDVSNDPIVQKIIIALRTSPDEKIVLKILRVVRTKQLLHGEERP